MAVDDSAAPVELEDVTAHADPDWTWPPFGPLEAAGRDRFVTAEWAPASTVRRPLVRLGGWTLLYRRG